MKKVFIVRPFGNRNIIREGIPETFDFDRVEKELIQAALEQLKNLAGGTTGIVFEAGDIREDMFSALLLADLVIADITIHNANVFYELGIRHSLRDQKTILIKCPGYDDTPFDIFGYRYIGYDKEDLAKTVPLLVQSIKDTLDADRKDSPVFNVLPQLQAQDPENYFALPKDFIDEVGMAAKAGWPGKLCLLAAEAADLPWDSCAYRLIGEALFQLRSFYSARRIWELVLLKKPDDLIANDRLATIYQRLAKDAVTDGQGDNDDLLARSDQVIDKLLADKRVGNRQRAEAYSLQARNAKTRWLNDWQRKPEGQRRRQALQSIYLQQAYEAYRNGFSGDLNHFYSGINAFGLLTVILTLAGEEKDAWNELFIDEELAAECYSNYEKEKEGLLPAVRFSIECAIDRAKARGDKEEQVWAVISQADLVALTVPKPIVVKNIYSMALDTAGNFNKDAALRQLQIYEELHVMYDNMAAILASTGKVVIEEGMATHMLLFTGHMIDAPERGTPRFPASKEKEVREKIKAAILEERERLKDRAILNGIAGGACGGDILFHELCQELSIPSRMHLAAPRDAFIPTSVSIAGPGWVDRFNDLYEKLPHPELGLTSELPKWLSKKEQYTIWQRNNLWELYSALANGSGHMTLLAFWDGNQGDGPGGTADMVEQAAQRGAKVMVLHFS